MSDSALNAFLARGTTVDRVAFTPSPPTPVGADLGYLWWDTDLAALYAWDGSGWQTTAGGGGGGASTETAWTPPTLASFTHQNFAGTTSAVVPALGGMRLIDTGPGSNTNALRALLVAVPGTHWQATARLRRQTLLVPFVSIGVVVRDSGSGKSLIFGQVQEKGGFGYVGFNSDSSFAYDGSIDGSQDTSPDIWVRVAWDGTDILTSISYDGEYFNLVATHPLTDFFTGFAITDVGVGLNANNAGLAGGTAGGPIVVDCYSWDLVTLP